MPHVPFDYKIQGVYCYSFSSQLFVDDARLVAQPITKWNIADFIWYFCVSVRSPPRARSRTPPRRRHWCFPSITTSCSARSLGIPNISLVYVYHWSLMVVIRLPAVSLFGTLVVVSCFELWFELMETWRCT